MVSALDSGWNDPRSSAGRGGVIVLYSWIRSGQNVFFTDAPVTLFQI